MKLSTVLSLLVMRRDVNSMNKDLLYQRIFLDLFILYITIGNDRLLQSIFYFPRNHLTIAGLLVV